MQSEQLNKSFNKNSSFLIKNVLDFSFGDEKNDNISDDIDMIDNTDNNTKTQENQKDYMTYSEKSNNEIDNGFSKYDYIFENNKINELTKNSELLISKKRKRKNELYPMDDEVSIFKQLQNKNIKLNKKLKNSLMNISYNNYEHFGHKLKNQKSIEIKEDSTVNIKGDYENNNMINDDYDINVDIFINKFKKFNLNKNFGLK